MSNLFIGTLTLLLTFHVALYSQSPHSNSELPLSINEDGAAPDESAIVDIQSSDKGLLVPRMPFCDIEKITDPAEGLMIYDTEFHCLRIYIQGIWHCLYQKLNGSGAEINVTGWANPTYDEDWNTGIAVDSEENIYVTMETEDNETRLRKFDDKGNILWDIFENIGYKQRCPLIDSNDNVFIIGGGPSFNGTAVNPAGDYIAKTLADGSASDIYVLPGASMKDLAVDDAGNVSFVFTFEQITLNGTTYTDVAGDSITKIGIAKLDNNFNELWIQLLDVYDTGQYYFEQKIAADDAGNVYVTSTHDNGVGHFSIAPSEIKNSNIFTSKLASSDGTPLWTNSFGTDLEFRSLSLAWADRTVFVGTVEKENFSPSTSLESNVLIKGYHDTFNTLKFTAEPEGMENWMHFAVNDDANTLAVIIAPKIAGVSTYNTPAELLLYNYDPTATTAFQKYEMTFFRPGSLTLNNSGSVIYGIGEGTTIGNTVIENNNEDHIIYKIYNQ